jgi:hypothetical protein
MEDPMQIVWVITCFELLWKHFEEACWDNFANLIHKKEPSMFCKTSISTKSSQIQTRLKMCLADMFISELGALVTTLDSLSHPFGLLPQRHAMTAFVDDRQFVHPTRIFDVMEQYSTTFSFLRGCSVGLATSNRGSLWRISQICSLLFSELSILSNQAT